MFSQVVIDNVIVQGDLDFLTVLALGFGLLFTMQALVELLRGHVSLYLSNSMTYQMQVNLFRHLLRLPPDFFVKRHVGDIQSRVDSLEPVEELITSTLISAVLDGLLAILTLVVIFLYSWQLSLIVLISVLLHIVGTMVLFPIVKKRTEQQIQAGAKEQTTFLEILRALVPIKAFGREKERETVWKNALADKINQSIRLEKIGIWSGTGEQLLFSVSGILILFFGARLVLETSFTLGMLIAFLGFQAQFSDKARALVENLFEFRMIGLHLERLSDMIKKTFSHS